jgi:hypothetical protein
MRPNLSINDFVNVPFINSEYFRKFGSLLVAGPDLDYLFFAKQCHSMSNSFSAHFRLCVSAIFKTALQSLWMSYRTVALSARAPLWMCVSSVSVSASHALRHPSGVMKIAGCFSALTYHVRRVVSRSAQKQMRWIYAGRHIASVAAKYSFRYRAKIKLVRNAVGVNPFFVKPRTPISVFVFDANPKPASFRFDYSTPKLSEVVIGFVDSVCGFSKSFSSGIHNLRCEFSLAISRASYTRDGVSIFTQIHNLTREDLFHLL